MPSLAIPMMGNYSIVFAAAAEALGVVPWIATSGTQEKLKLGLEASPETACLPFKMFTGHFVKAAREGVEYAVMVNSTGTCRLCYYGDLQRKILRDMGAGMRVFGLGHDGIKPPLVRYFDPAPWPFLKGVGRALLKLGAIDEIEKEAWRTRALETSRGEVTFVLDAVMKDLLDAQTAAEIRRVWREAARRLRAVEVDGSRNPMRVGLVGEAAVLRDRFMNHRIEETLGGMGIEVRNFYLLGEDLRKAFRLRFRGSHRGDLEVARPFLGSMVGGHALKSVADAIRCARAGYDGVVHVCPAGCMPEISVRPVLKAVQRELGIPILEISLDEHTSEVGLITRLGAFVDMLLERKRTGKRWTGDAT